MGRPEFLYVADCKLASSENLRHIPARGGRFVTVLPRTHKEDAQFRARLRQNASAVTWQPVYETTDEQGKLRDRLSVCSQEMVTSDGYRLLWFHSTRKAELDATRRNRQLQMSLSMLRDLQARLLGPRTRFRRRCKVEQAVTQILEQQEVTSLLLVRIEEQVDETFRQIGPGRPTEYTRYRKETRPAYSLSWEIDRMQVTETEREDGVFPLLTNDRSFSAEQVLRAYKRQPFIEKRFSQFKTDFSVAPVYLKNVARIQGLLAVYFLVLLIQTLLERELRGALARSKIPSLPLYPEGRACTRPTTQRVLELFEPIQRHVVRRRDADAGRAGRQGRVEPAGAQVLVTALTPLQRRILRLLGLPAATYGS